MGCEVWMAKRILPVEYIGVKMGYKEAKSWEYDINFMRYQALNYLAIRNILDPMHSKVG